MGSVHRNCGRKTTVAGIYHEDNLGIPVSFRRDPDSRSHKAMEFVASCAHASNETVRDSEMMIMIIRSKLHEHQNLVLNLEKCFQRVCYLRIETVNMRRDVIEWLNALLHQLNTSKMSVDTSW